MIEIPQKGGGTFEVPDALIRTWQAQYPNINVRHEIQKAANWIEGNPRNLKQDVKRFLINWLNRAKPSPVGSMPSEASGHYAVVAERNRQAEPQGVRASDETVQEHIRKLRGMLGMRV